MKRFLALLFATMTLSACASAFGEATQEVTFVTPGANDSVCYIDNGDVTYRAWPPETIRISKRPADLEVRCLADGNREKTITIDPDHEPMTLANALNGFAPGIWVDYETGALFAYPKTVTVDFTNIPAGTMELPDYHKHIMQNPDLYGMEEFIPGRAALIKDKYATDTELKKREFPDQPPSFNEFTGSVSSSEVESGSDSGSESESSAASSEAGAPSDLVSDLTKQMNPQVFGPSETEGFVGGTADTGNGDDGVASTGPVTIYPIQQN